MDPKDTSQISLESLPGELILSILSYDGDGDDDDNGISLAQLYQLRPVCKALAPFVKRAFIDRVRRVLTVQKDIQVFIEFLESIRELFWVGYYNEHGAVRPIGLGRLLNAAQVPVDSYAVYVIAKTLTTKFSYYNHSMGAFYKGMDATPADLKVALHALGYHTRDPSDLETFLEPFEFSEAVVEDLYSFSSFSFAARWISMAKLFKWANNLPIATFRETRWPRLIAAARKQVDQDALVPTVAKFVRFLEAALAESGSTNDGIACLLEPSSVLSLAETGRLIAHMTCANLDHIESYLEPSSSNPDKDITAVSVEDSRTVFQQLTQHKRFALDFVPLFLVHNRWPRHVNPEFPFLNCPLLNDEAIVKLLCDILGREEMVPSCEAGEVRSRLGKFVQANALQRNIWIECLKDKCWIAEVIAEVHKDEEGIDQVPWVCLMRDAFDAVQPATTAEDLVAELVSDQGNLSNLSHDDDGR